MKTPQIIVVLAILQLAARAADLTGAWKAEFESQIGIQKYTFHLKQEGNTVSGNAKSEIAGEKRESKLKDGKVEGDNVSFVESLNFQGNDLEIRYSGTVSGKEMKLTRQVGEFATEQLVAKLDGPAEAPAANGPAVWGFISVTNNDTHHITTITPP